MRLDSSYITVDVDAVAHNLRQVAKKTGVKVMFVVKADSYGLGAVPLARALEPECDFFGVALVAEGLQLRRAGIQKPILCLGHGLPDTWQEAIRAGIRLTVSSLEMARQISETALAMGQTALLHLAVDTGMSRIGFQVEPEAALECAAIAALPGVEIEGCFSHFARADEADPGAALAQKALFDRFLGLLEAQGVQIPLRHLNNSAATIAFDSHYDMVRAGIISYGMYPSVHSHKERLPLRQVVNWYTAVTHVKTLPAGRHISYGGTFETAAPTRVATVSVGYADGYRRSLSGNFHVLIGGQKAPILGRICMDQMMVDVTQIPDVAVGTRVVLLGRSGDAEITPEEMSDAAGIITYDLTCGLSRRVGRRYLKDGKEL